jgi:transcriptional regulator with XRE-family HTH domain
MRIRIRDLREDRDIKQAELAEATGINQQTISNYETGKRDVPAEVLETLADYYGVSVDYLMGRTNTKIPYPKK